MTKLTKKNQIHLLQTSVELRKSFRTLFLLINKIKESVEELKTNLDSIMMEKVSSRSRNSILKSHSNLISRLEKVELDFNSFDDDGHLNQPSTRVRDDISCFSQSSRRQLQSQRLTHVSQKSVKDDLMVKKLHQQCLPSTSPKTEETIIFPPEQPAIFSGF